MKKSYYFLLIAFFILAFVGCKKDEASKPASTSFTVDKTSGLLGVDTFTFSVQKVSGAQSISLLPYGLKLPEPTSLSNYPNQAGILIDDGQFVSGVAKIKVVYQLAGTFEAVVVTNNHNATGTSIKNSVSPPTSITISSSKAEISAFSLTFHKDVDKEKLTVDGKIGDKPDANDNIPVTVTFPYASGKAEVTAEKLTANFSSSPFSTVTVADKPQKSETDTQNFSSAVTYKVTSYDTKVSRKYLVTVTVTPIEKLYSFESAVVVNRSKKTDDNKNSYKESYPVFVENGATDADPKYFVIYDTDDIAKTYLDSVSVDYKTTGKFSFMKFNKKIIKGSDIVDISGSNITFVSYAQDSVHVFKDYKVYSKKAPILNLKLTGLNPIIKGANSRYNITFRVLGVTPLDALETEATFDTQMLSGVSVTAINKVTKMIMDGKEQEVKKPFNSKDMVDYSGEPVVFELEVTDNGLKYYIRYTVDAVKVN